MRNCPYKALLYRAMNGNPLLPFSPSAYYGTILHKLLELISKGVFTSEKTFDAEFDRLVSQTEEKLTNQGFSSLVPLQKRVKDFTMKRILLKQQLPKTSVIPAKSNNTEYSSEEWLETKDGTIGGKVDLIIESAKETEILDFKTGAITDDILDDNDEIYTEIKKDYQEQLKLYAYLYFETEGKYPTRLTLVDLARQRFPIDFTEKECFELFNEARELLKITNESIETGQFTANPTESNCKYCLYRPACSFFLNALKSENLFNDVSGILRRVRQFQNGNVTIYLQSDDRQYTVSAFLPEEFDEFQRKVGSALSVFNLKRELRPFFYSATLTTIAYA